MTRFYKSLWFMVLAIFALSCSDDDALPPPIVDFSVGTSEIEVGIPVMFDNLSTNAARYEWIIGEGQDPITDISPTITFTSPGTVTVTLIAYTADEQSMETSEEITVKQRILTGISVNVYPDTNGGAAWDPGEMGVDSLADIFLQLFPTDSPENDEIIIAGPQNNLQSPFGLNIDPAAGIVLKDEDWSFILDDFDGVDINTATAEDFERIVGVGFNPVQGPTFKNDAGDAGFVSIIFFDQAIGLLDVDVSFTLE